MLDPDKLRKLHALLGEFLQGEPTATGPTFGQLTEQYLKRERERLRPTTWRDWRRILHREILPAVGERLASQITTAEWQAVFDAIRSPNVHNEARTVVRLVYKVAKIRHHAALDIDARFITRKRHVPTLEDMQAIWRACGDLGDAGALIRLLQLTGCRRRELGELQWREIEPRPDGPVAVIPAHRTKATRRREKPHTVVLVPQAMAILEPLRHQDDRAVFNVRNEEQWSRIKYRIDKLLGPDFPHFTFHQFRHAIVTHMANHLRVSRDVCRAVLSHSEGGGNAAVYLEDANRLAEQREALGRWAKVLTAPDCASPTRVAPC